ncbi:MAG: hypothetical protein ACKVT0_22025 [Planctomycetaceae bacterium]
MSPQDQAYNVLKNARDVLTKRLVERILEASEEILDDAAGLSFSNDIEQVYEHCGMRLQHVQNLINLLPPPEPAISMSSTSMTSQPHANEPIINHTEIMTSMVGLTETDHAFAEMIPEQTAASSVEWPADQSATSKHPTFVDFAQQIIAGDLKSSSHILSLLLDIPLDRARKCTEWFHTRLQSDADFLQQARRLRESVSAENVNDTLDLLWQCFGLQGFEAVALWPRLQSQFTGKP